MSKMMINIQVDVSNFESIVKQMPAETKIRLIKVLERDTWSERLDNVVSKIRAKFKKAGITDKEISQICETARKRNYNEQTKSNNR